MSLGSLSLAACSSGAGLTLPSTLKSSTGGSVSLPSLSFKRTSARTVSVTANGAPWFTMSYDANGLTATVGNTALSTKVPSAIPTVGHRITDAQGRTLSATDAKTWVATNRDGKQLTVASVASGKTLYKFQAPTPFNLVVGHDFLKPDSRLTKYQNYDLAAGKKTASGSRSVKDINCYQTASYFQGQCGYGSMSFGCGSWFVTNYCTGTIGAGSSDYSTSAPTGSGPDAGSCIYQILVAMGIFQVTAMTETAFVAAFAAATAGLALTGVGAIAEAIAIVMAILLTIGIYALDDEVFQNLIEPCLPGAS